MSDATELVQAVESARARVETLEAEQRAARAPWDAQVATVRAELDHLEAEVTSLATRAEALEGEQLRVQLGAGLEGDAAYSARLAFVVMTCLGGVVWLATLHGDRALLAALLWPAAALLAQWWGARRGK